MKEQRTETVHSGTEVRQNGGASVAVLKKGQQRPGVIHFFLTWFRV